MSWRSLILAFLLPVLLAACGSAQLPYEKEQPASGQAQDMVRPPWETFVQAGPGAEKDIDLETLNGPLRQPPAMDNSAAPAVADGEAVPPPETPEATEPAPQPVEKKPVKKADATEIKAVAVPVVTGSPGKGNGELTAAMRKALADAGWPVVKEPQSNALTIRGRVSLAPPQGETQKVSLTWVVTAPDGSRLGDVSQSNDVPAGSLAQGWGENAGYAAQAAAEGIFNLIQKYR